MWVVVRLVLAAIGFVIRMPWRLRGIGEPAGEYRGIPYFVRNQRELLSWFGKKRWNHQIGMALQAPTWIRMTDEGAFDRFCKRIGISNEQWTGDAAFDDAVYVTCDHPFVGALLSSSPAWREAILLALRKGSVHYDGSFVWVVQEWCDEIPSPSPELVDGLRRTSLLLQESELPNRFRDPFLWRAFVIEGVIWSIAGYVLGALADAFVQGKVSVHVSQFWTFMLGILFAILIFALLVAFIILGMRGSSRGHRVVAESVIVLAMSLPFAGMQLASDTNRVLDDTPSIVLEGVAKSCE